MSVHLKTPDEIAGMRVAGRLAYEIHDLQRQGSPVVAGPMDAFDVHDLARTLEPGAICRGRWIQTSSGSISGGFVFSIADVARQGIPVVIGPLSEAHHHELRAEIAHAIRVLPSLQKVAAR